VLNRGVRRAVLFDTDAEYARFERILLQALRREAVRLLAYCAMPNHWHLVLWPTHPGQLSLFMHWLTCTHAQRWHSAHGTSGTGAVYQGRFKAFPVRSDHHLLRVCRYVERNPLRAQLVTRAEDWRWSSLWRRGNFCDHGVLHDWPVERPANWLALVNEPETNAEVEALRAAIRRGAPFGEAGWQAEAARPVVV
jgi:putative transposase